MSAPREWWIELSAERGQIVQGESTVMTKVIERRAYDRALLAVNEARREPDKNKMKEILIAALRDLGEL